MLLRTNCLSGSLHLKKRTSGSKPSSAGAKDRIHRPANNNPAVMSRHPRTTRTTTGLPVPMVNRLDEILNTIQPIEMSPDPDREVEVTCECRPEYSEDFDEHLSIDDCFDAAADFLGQDWLNAQVETFRDSPSPKNSAEACKELPASTERTRVRRGRVRITLPGNINAGARIPQPRPVCPASPRIQGGHRTSGIF